MKLPSVLHPKRFRIAGMLFEVVAYVALTDAQAGKIAMLHYRSRKFTKRDQDKVHRVISLFDQDSVGLL